jgi:DNA-binding CsgD family transcriptional regulator
MLKSLPEDLPEEVRSALAKVNDQESYIPHDTFCFALHHQHRQIAYLSPPFWNMFGHAVGQKHIQNLFALMQWVDPLDLNAFIKNQKKLWQNLCNWSDEKQLLVRIAQDVRIKPIAGKSMRLLISQQIVRTANHKPDWSVGYCTDITHIKQDGDLSLAVFAGDHQQLTLKKVVGWGQHEIFTERESDVLRLLSKGYKSKDIEKILHISLHTVRTHRRNMLKKTKLKNTTQLVNFAVREGLIQLES